MQQFDIPRIIECMFGTDSHDEASQQSDPETGLRHLNALRAQSYTAHAQLVLEVWEHISCRMFDNQTDHLAQRAAFADIATILGISRASVKAMDDTVMGIGQIPGLRDAFTSGELDYAKVRTIVSVVSLGASGETCTLMAKRILSDARHLTPGPLRTAVWAAWMDTDTREAQQARAHLRKYERKVYVRQGADSMCWLSACLTDLEGAEAQILIDELATSVCDHDPRTPDTRRADALMALLHGEGFLRCQCEDPTCPLATAAPPKRRAHLLQILVSIETLLGLTADPATLPDGTPLDPDVVRVLAEDATWRAILTEMRTLATTTGDHGGGGNDTGGGNDGDVGDGDGSAMPHSDPTANPPRPPNPNPPRTRRRPPRCGAGRTRRHDNEVPDADVRNRTDRTRRPIGTAARSREPEPEATEGTETARPYRAPHPRQPIPNRSPRIRSVPEAEAPKPPQAQPEPAAETEPAAPTPAPDC